MSKGLEPYDGKQLANYLINEHRAVLDHVTGDHAFYRLPEGRKVGVSHKGSYCTSTLAHQVALRLGKSLHELRADLGYQSVSAGKTKKRVKRDNARPSSTKRAALDSLDAAIEAIHVLAQSIRSGQRDQRVYGEVAACGEKCRQAAVDATEKWVAS